jgi:hypothetical protein
VDIWLYQRQLLLDIALSSTVNDSEVEWRRFVEICVLLGDSSEGLCEVICDYFAAMSGVCARLKKIDRTIVNAWDYLLNSFFPAKPDGADLRHLLPLYHSVTNGEFDASAKDQIDFVGSTVGTVKEGILLITVARMFFCDALKTFDAGGATDIREYVRQVYTPHEGKQTDKTSLNWPNGTLAVTPDCPKCGRATVLRFQRKGRTPGRSFWGCSSFPACRGTLPLYKDASRYPQFQNNHDSEDSDWFYDYMNEAQGPAWDQ